MEDDLLIAIYNPGSDVATGQVPSQLIWGRTGNETLLGYQPVPADSNPDFSQPRVDILLGDFVVDDPAFRQWNDVFSLGDWQAPYYANGNPANVGLSDFALVADFNPAMDFIQLHGSPSDYQIVDAGVGSAIVFQSETGPDVIGVVLGVFNLDLGANYFQFRGTTPPPGPVQPQTTQLGTLGFDAGRSITTDPSGNVYVGGSTTGSLAAPNAGTYDGFVAKYDSQGNLLFTQQLGSSGYEEIFGIQTDNQGNYYVSGLTTGNLGGPQQSQQYDAFVAKYDSDGNQIWIRQIGQNVQFPTFSLAVDPETGDVFISGPNVRFSLENPDDAYVLKLDTNGNQQWLTEVGTTGFANFDESYGITVADDGSVYATGWTNGSLGGPNQGLYDNWLAKYNNTTGAVEWIRQYGSSDYEWSWSVDTDSLGNVYTAGWTLGNLGGTNAGSYDVYLTKYDSQGTLQWIKQFGTAADDEARSLFIDDNDNIFLTGYTTGNLGGTNAGSFDAWVAKFDTSGNQTWITQFGTPDRDDAVSITGDSFGNLYVTGDTQGSLGALNAGSFDSWVAKLSAGSGSLLSFSGGSQPATAATTLASSVSAVDSSLNTQLVAGQDRSSSTWTSNESDSKNEIPDSASQYTETSKTWASNESDSPTTPPGDSNAPTLTNDQIGYIQNYLEKFVTQTLGLAPGSGGPNGTGLDTLINLNNPYLPPSIPDSETLFGDTSDDIIFTRSRDSIVYAGEGNNTIVGYFGGNNTIYVGAGNDIIATASGDDTIFAAEGNNVIYAGDGDNTVYAGAGNDSIFTGNGDDLIYAGEGVNTIRSGAGDDIIYSGSGNDSINAGTGSNTIWLGSGADTIELQVGGTSTIHNFSLNDGDRLVLAAGLSFGQLSITQGTELDANNTLIKTANQDLLAILTGVQANWVTSGTFSTMG